MTTISDLLQQSGLSHQEFADILGIRMGSLDRYLNGKRVPPDGLIGDACQLLEDISLEEAKLLADPDDFHQRYYAAMREYRTMKRALENCDENGS